MGKNQSKSSSMAMIGLEKKPTQMHGKNEWIEELTDDNGTVSAQWRTRIRIPYPSKNETENIGKIARKSTLKTEVRLPDDLGLQTINHHTNEPIANHHLLTSNERPHTNS